MITPRSLEQRKEATEGSGNLGECRLPRSPFRRALMKAEGGLPLSKEDRIALRRSLAGMRASGGNTEHREQLIERCLYALGIRKRETQAKRFVARSDELLREWRNLRPESEERRTLLVNRITSLFVNVSYQVLRNITLKVGSKQDATEVVNQLRRISELSENLSASSFSYAQGLSDRISWAIQHKTDRMDFVRPGAALLNSVILANTEIPPEELVTRGPKFIARYLAAREGGDLEKIAAQLGVVFQEPISFRDVRDWLRFTPTARQKLAQSACDWWKEEIVKPIRDFQGRTPSVSGESVDENSRESFARSLGITVDILDRLEMKIGRESN